MSDNMNKALADALAYGTGVLHKGDYVACEDMYRGPPYGDVHISQHCPNCEAQAAEIEQWRACALYDATMEGPVFKGWDRSALERCRRAALGETK